MKKRFLILRYIATVCLMLIISARGYAQRIYASSQDVGATGLLCLNCTVTNPGNAADGNIETYSTLNVAVGVASSTYQDLIFSSKVAANTPVTVKLGSGDKLLSLTALGGVLLQAYNGSAAIGQPVAASTLLTALSNNNQTEVSITPNAQYDRIRVTLDGGLVGLLGNLYLYEAFYNGPANGACNSAIDELHGISSALLGLGADVGGVVNPQNAIDGDINTASTLNAGVGLLGAYTQQTIIYEAPSVKGDSIRMTIGIPDALVQVGLLNNISVSTYNGTNGTAETYNITANLIQLKLLGDASSISKYTFTWAPVNVFDRVQLTLGGIANVLSTVNLYEAQKLIPRPVIKFNNVVTNNPSVCSGSTAVLTATAVPNTTVLWYNSATATSPIFTGNSFTTPALTASTTYYVAAMRTGCTDQSERTIVNVTVNNIPANPVIATPAVTVCPGQQASFSANAVTGVTYNWYTVATGGTPVATGNTFTTGALTQTTSYYAEAVAGGTCVSPGRTMVTATVSPLPATPTLTNANVSICSGDAAVLTIATPVDGVTYTWYSTATGGTALNTGTSFTTPNLTSSTIYYVEADNATGCPSSARAQANVTVTPKPADPTLAASQTSITAGQTTTINVTNAQTGVTYNWYTSATAASSVYTGASYTTPALYTTTTYYVSALNATGCTSANRTAITINVSINNNSPCSFANQQTNSANGVCIGCGVSNPDLATDADTTTASTLNVLAGLLGGNVQQQLTFQQPGYKGDTVKIVVGSPFNLLNVSLLSSITVSLYNGATQVESYTASNPLLKLGLLSPGSNKYAIYVPATADYTSAVITLNSGAANLVTQLMVYYAVQEFPTPTVSPANPEICKGSGTTLTINTPDAGTYQWFTTPTGGSASGTGTSFNTPALTGNTTYYIAYTRGGTCVAPVRYPVQILVDDQPANPVVSPSTVSIPSGKTATFTATVPANVTVKWYDSPTSTTPLATGNTFTTPALTTQTTYYAEASSGSCLSPGRTPATVNITPNVVPDVTVTPATQTVAAGTTTTLTASSTSTGVTFNWYTTPTGGTPIYTGATFVTPPVFTSTTYYADATVTATGTVSAARASGAVNVSTSASSPTPCDAAIDQTNDISGLACLLCAVNNPTGAVDADRNSFSQLDVGVGLLGSYAEQTLRFANTGQASDTVVVELGTPASLASVGVLSQISLATYNGTTYNNDRFSLNTSLISITLLNGTTRFRYAFVATHSFDRVEIRLNSGVAGALSALNIYDASQEVAAPTVSATSVAACQGTQATLTATVPSYETVKWYTSATGGTPVFTGSVFNTPALNASTTYYAEASRTADGCAQAVRTPVNVVVTPVPTAPVVAAATQTVCSGSTATFSATAVTGVTYTWYTTPTGGTAVFTGNPFTTPALTANAVYYVQADVAGSCSSSTRTMVTANVTTSPLTPTVSQSTVQDCSGSTAVLSASSSQSGVTFEWFTAPTGGTPVFTGAQYTTPALTATTNYYVEADAGNCASPTRAQVTVNVNPTPAAPTLTVNPTNATINSGQTATITASSTTAGATFNWYTTATGGTPIFSGSPFTTPALTSNTTYYVESQLSASGCVSPQRTAVTITVNPIFSTSCDFASSETTSNSGVLCVGCIVTNETNSVNIDTTDYAQLNLPIGLLTGSVSQNLIFSDPGIKGDTVKIKLRIPGTLLSAAILSHIQITSFNGATSNNDGLTLDNGAIKVQLLSSNNDVLVKFLPGAAYDNVQVSLVNNGVALLAALDVFYATKEVEQAVLNATTENICSGSTATFTVTNARTGVTYTWYDAATGGSVVGTGSTFTTPALTATTTYYVQTSRTSNSCPNPNRVAATANVSPAPVTPTLTQNAVTACAGDAVTLSVTNAGTGTVQWYDAATGGNLLFTGASYQVTPLTTTSYYAQITNGSCTSATRAQATVTINARPLQPTVAANNLTVCAGSPATINIQSPETGVTYNYYLAATGGAAVGSGVSFTTPAITQNTIYYIEAAGSSGCINNNGRTQVTITVTSQQPAPTLSATQTQVCSGGSATISVTNPVSGITYNWYDAATAGNLVFTGTSYTVTNVTANASYFVEAATSAGCTSSSRTETDITVIPVPPSPQVQASAGGLSVCTGSSASLSIVNPDANDVYRWYDAATGGTLLYTGVQFNTPPLTAQTTYYVEAATAGNCNPSARTAVTVNVNSLPATPVLVNNNVSVCAGSSATLQISSPDGSTTYQWYDSPTMTNLLFTGTTYMTPAVTGTTYYYVSAVNASGCSSNNTAQAMVSIQPAPTAPALSNTDTVTTCSGTQATLSIANPQAGYTYNWYTSATGGSSVYTGTDYQTPSLTGSITYYVDATNLTGCTSTTRTPVYINVPPVPAAPQINTSTAAVCPGSSATLTATSADGSAIIQWYDAATGGNLVYTGNVFNTPALSASTTYYAQAVSSSGCTPSSRTPITVSISQPLDAPVVTVASTSVNSVVFAWNAVNGATGYQVSFDNGVTFSSTTTALADTVNGLQPDQSVTIVVRAEGATSCLQSANSAAVTGTAKNPQGDAIFVPNAFTPNGDGKNDIEYVYGASINSIKFYVYNQWGQLIFQSTSMSYGWDGTYKGNKQPVGVYVYYLEAVMKDGTTVKKKGTITLLR